jgi:hypothetical protein
MSKYRKRILVAIAVAIVLFYVGDWLLENMVLRPLETRRQKANRWQKKILKTERELARARKAGKELLAWEAQSLPSDTEVARSLYQAWLLELVNHAGFTNPNVDSGEPAGRKGMYHTLSFSVRGRGSLDRSLGITPLQKANELSLSIAIEALVLPGATRKDQLATQQSDRLAFDSLDDYQPIVTRNLFGVGGGLDATDQTYLTAVTYSNGEPEAWFTLRGEGKILKLHKGDELEVGQFHGELTEIEDTDVIIESEGQRWLMTIGDNITQAYALPPEY